MKELSAKPTALLFIVISIIFRLIPHPANFTPVGATALFGGAKLERPWNYLAPLFILYVTDLFLGGHSTLPYVYVSFIAITFLGEKLLGENSRTGRVVTIALVSSLLFFTITNFGVWASTEIYPRTIEGLIACYVAALPFLRNTIAGDMIFSVGFFAMYAWAEKTQLVTKLDLRLVKVLKD